MSKAFTSEEAADGPIVVPARAPLPPGVPNYVTARGKRLLKAELETLKAERARLESDRSDEAERKNRLAVLDLQMAELVGRIASAKVIDPKRQARDAVRFGATVTLRTRSGEAAGEERRYRIVGVDEADPVNGCVAFVSPIAQSIVGRRVGETTTLQTERGEEVLEIVAIDYEPD